MVSVLSFSVLLSSVHHLVVQPRIVKIQVTVAGNAGFPHQVPQLGGHLLAFPHAGGIVIQRLALGCCNLAAHVAVVDVHVLHGNGGHLIVDHRLNKVIDGKVFFLQNT